VSQLYRPADSQVQVDTSQYVVGSFRTRMTLPGWDCFARSLGAMSKAREVNALLMGFRQMSTRRLSFHLFAARICAATYKCDAVITTGALADTTDAIGRRL
jgi:hypothetical protein